jgi:hypothetical protein
MWGPAANVLGACLSKAIRGRVHISENKYLTERGEGIHLMPLEPRARGVLADQLPPEVQGFSSRRQGLGAVRPAGDVGAGNG